MRYPWFTACKNDFGSDYATLILKRLSPFATKNGFLRRKIAQISFIMSLLQNSQKLQLHEANGDVWES
jgi:hypothetical protein